MLLNKLERLSDESEEVPSEWKKGFVFRCYSISACHGSKNHSTFNQRAFFRVARDAVVC